MADPITIEAWVDAPPQTVWNAYTTPEHITRWNFAHESWHCPSAAAELKVGGAYSARMEARDGSGGFDLNATYTAVTPPEALSMELEDGRRVDVIFTPEGTGTRVVTTFDPETENPVEMQRDGWQAILDNFKTYAETLA